MVRCPTCDGKLKKISEERMLPDPEFVEMSDEDIIDFFAEEITGEYENYGITEIVYQCEECDKKWMIRKK